jgi:hypothetical protein
VAGGRRNANLNTHYQTQIIARYAHFKRICFPQVRTPPRDFRSDPTLKTSYPVISGLFATARAVDNSVDKKSD